MMSLKRWAWAQKAQLLIEATPRKVAREFAQFSIIVSHDTPSCAELQRAKMMNVNYREMKHNSPVCTI
jgi:hypothetical protein